MTTLLQAALRGVGLVQLPCMVVEQELAQGRLLDIMPQWVPQGGVVHALFPSRRGLLPSVRTLIDYLAEHLEK
jgi:DNA-binding transcriptional LysR family regulator